MPLTQELPLVPLKKVVLSYLQNGCPESDVEPPFANTPNSLEWLYLGEDEWAETDGPTWIVSQAGAPEPLSDTLHTSWWSCPVEIRLIAPITATAQWVHDVEKRLHWLMNGVWHERELANQAERSPLAIRLTDVGRAMSPEVPIYCKSSTIALLQRIGVMGERIEIKCDVSVLCVMESE